MVRIDKDIRPGQPFFTLITDDREAFYGRPKELDETLADKVAKIQDAHAAIEGVLADIYEGDIQYVDTQYELALTHIIDDLRKALGKGTRKRG